LGGLTDEKYEARHLESILEDFFGDAMLSDVHQDLLVTSYDIHTRKPFFFKS
jgi:patatin-like phospholipase/acyl hydrolase